MTFDESAVRKLLLSLGQRANETGEVLAYPARLKPMGGPSSGPDMLEHADLLIAAGLATHAQEIVSARGDATQEGRDWVRRAYDDELWQSFLPTLRELLSLASTNSR